MFRCVILVPLAAAVRQNLLQTQEAVSQEVLEANETTQGVDAFQQWSLDTPVWAVTNNFLSRWKVTWPRIQCSVLLCMVDYIVLPLRDLETRGNQDGQTKGGTKSSTAKTITSNC